MHFSKKKITEFKDEFNITQSKHQGDAETRKVIDTYTIAAAKESVGV